jgi:hypothetical protein
MSFRVGNGFTMSFKESVIFIAGCVALGIGLVFGPGDRITAQDATVMSVVQHSESVMRGEALSSYSDN